MPKMKFGPGRRQSQKDVKYFRLEFESGAKITVPGRNLREAKKLALAHAGPNDGAIKKD